MPPSCKDCQLYHIIAQHVKVSTPELKKVVESGAAASVESARLRWKNLNKHMAEASGKNTTGIDEIGREASKSICPTKKGPKVPANKVIKNKKAGKGGKIPESKEEDFYETEEDFDLKNDTEDMEA